VRRSAHLDAVTDVLDDAGIKYQIEQGKHMKVLWTLNGRRMTSVVPTSTGDRWHGPIKARADVRRILKGRK
jgi:hypothetical protein